MPLSDKTREAIRAAAQSAGIDPDVAVEAGEKEIANREAAAKPDEQAVTAPAVSGQPQRFRGDQKIFEYHLPVITVGELRKYLATSVAGLELSDDAFEAAYPSAGSKTVARFAAEQLADLNASMPKPNGTGQGTETTEENE